MSGGQQSIDFEPPTNGTATSTAAAKRMRGKAAVIRERIRQFIASRHTIGATLQEIEDCLEISGDTVRPRVIELRRMALRPRQHVHAQDPSGQ